jgi:hypothetical protein
MRLLALLIALLIMVAGLTGILAPDRLLALRQYVVTPVGLWVITALRVGIGLVLIQVARISRAPRTLRALGAVVIVAGLATPFFGVERSRAVLDWAATQGRALMLVEGCVALALGVFLAFAVTARRPAPR